MSKQNGTKIIVAIMLLCMLLRNNIVNATTYTVGDSKGWEFDGGSWPNGKTFKAGDILVFKYNVGEHNTVVADKNGYNSCSIDGGKQYSSGNDELTLVKGTNYFICGIMGHCWAGMRIAVTAT